MGYIDIKNLYVEYVSKKGMLGRTQITKAVNDLSLTVNSGEILAIAGESGCGKSTLAKAIIGLEPAKSGEIIYNGKNILNMGKSGWKDYRKKVQMIFQNPYASLNPKMRIMDILKEPLIINSELSDIEIENRVVDVACKVGIDRECLDLFPHEFSGGQRQRIAIARALVLNPEIIVADEPVSALDVSIQAQIINLLLELKEKYNLTIIFISHDLGVIRHIADRVAIMYLGEIVELGTSDEIFYSPKHPYTAALIEAAPKLDSKKEKLQLLSGDLPSNTDLPGGCLFNTRCPQCMNDCKVNHPKTRHLSDTHFVKCFL